MSSGLIPLEDFEHAIAHLSFLPVTQSAWPPQVEKRAHRDEVGLEARGMRKGRGSDSSSSSIKNVPTLPLEIIDLIGRLLFSSSHHTGPPWLLALESPSLEEPSIQSSMRANFRALLQLSSACKSYRSLLAPLLWHSVYFHHPRHFGEFVQLMKRYKSISSPLSVITNGLGSSIDTAAAGPVYEWKQEYLLRLIKEFHLIMPQKYPGFNQDLLVTLLRDGMNHSLRHVIWEAEELPAASTLKAMVAQDYYIPNKHSITEEDTKHKYGLASEIQEEDIVQWTRDIRGGQPFPTKGELVQVTKVQRNREKSQGGLSSLSINCKCFWPGHASLAHFTSVQHIRFTYYDLFLLPPYLSAMLQHLHYPLLSLSMSTSKTSLFHSIPIINSGCFDNLQVLDLYPVTPEAPLPQAIRRCSKSLRILRLVMDISANHTNFDNFWKVLMGTDGDDYPTEEDYIPMEALEMLHIDPMPQQNTAPSFASFVEACPRLEWVNGRKSDSFAPGMEPINPDEITSAMYF
jgi:hypothetical protein